VQTALFQQLGDNVGVVPVHQGTDLANLAPTAAKGASLLREATSYQQPLFFTLPETSFGTILITQLRQFVRDPDKLPEVLQTLEQARQQAY
jgi:hypothetical protein